MAFVQRKIVCVACRQVFGLSSMWQWLMGMDKSAGKEQRMVGFYPLGQGDSSKKFQVYTQSLWLCDELGGSPFGQKRLAQGLLNVRCEFGHREGLTK